MFPLILFAPDNFKSKLFVCQLPLDMLSLAVIVGAFGTTVSILIVPVLHVPTFPASSVTIAVTTSTVVL